MILTNEQLDDLALRCKKRWKVRYDEIEALIEMARGHLRMALASPTVVGAANHGLAMGAMLDRPDVSQQLKLTTPEEWARRIDPLVDLASIREYGR